MLKRGLRGTLVVAGAVLCVSCGTNLTTGQRLATESTVGSVLSGGLNVSVQRSSTGGMQLCVGPQTYQLQGYSSVWFVQKATDFTPAISNW